MSQRHISSIKPAQKDRTLPLGQPGIVYRLADWMRRNLDSRMETVAPVGDVTIRAELERILGVYESDNTSAWDMQTDGHDFQRCVGIVGR